MTQEGAYIVTWHKLNIQVVKKMDTNYNEYKAKLTKSKSPPSTWFGPISCAQDFRVFSHAKLQQE